ncbi:rod shape-determining protein MreD [Periweissella cryptocerci]|uniref:Rod shape-determining protein MreD n=1 Tax=Periweissella cryptocerci TaxID=2506420 RepID=A0A4P6YS81_9LACO|nr:rod shape-determining protein MreD [Periweissella cryptocerci]QBO35482.1 rod shape-determining protein MreD [Periweissella cryptocerci]
MFGLFGGYHTKLKWIFPLVMFFALFLDGALFSNMAGILTRGGNHILPMFLVIWLVYGVVYQLDDDGIPLYVWALVAGLIYDMFYTGIIGGFTVGLPVMIWLARELRYYLSDSVLSVLMVFILSLTVLQVFSYLAANVADLMVDTPLMYILHTFTPTLALNVVLAAVLYVPLNMLFSYLKEN